MHIEYIWIVLAVIVLLIELWAIKSLLRSAASSENKGTWLVVIIFVPLLGFLLWLCVGPRQAHGEHPGAGRG
ncbi:PLDc_N domain-containing protein [Pseudomonas sp. MSSRFD41]|uniref:PLD nuclease N-terminal domain-containing protein n=1 Tax=unclassified Pseudomonas TaxID=196821 RepID=UPI00163B14FE|nr:PLD nuclease N-terminal domain-containing protein [Pseudomonas sp. MSSRFD41]MBC2659111.1 PLDc_N domain-containing protein [Pseudomonas sp. MSSRFD41]